MLKNKALVGNSILIKGHCRNWSKWFILHFSPVSLKKSSPSKEFKKIWEMRRDGFPLMTLR
jgi:hypothetical protein